MRERLACGSLAASPRKDSTALDFVKRFVQVTDPTTAGRGRLAEVLATRGGRAEPEAPFVIEHREALIYMLCQAAELEHGIPLGELITTLPGGPEPRWC